MEDRQLRIATVLVASLAALMLLIWLWEPPEEELDPEATAPVWQVEADEVVRLEVDRPDGPLVLQKSDGGWRIEEPFRYPAHTREVDYLLGELERVEKGIPIEGDPADFGIGEVTARLVTESGEEKTLAVGDQAPVGWRTYVAAADGSVAAVAGVVGERLRMDAADLKDPHLLEYLVTDVRRVTIEGPEGTLSVHGEGPTWWVEGYTRADPDAVDDLLVGLREVRFDAFYEGELEGIAEPLYRVRVALDDETIGFDVGEDGPQGKLVRTLDGRAGWIASDKLALLGQGPKDVGDPHAFPVEGAESVQIRLGETAWTAEPDAVAEVPIVYLREAPPAPAEEWGEVVAGEHAVVIGQVVGGEYRTAQDRAGGAPYRVRVSDLDQLLP